MGESKFADDDYESKFDDSESKEEKFGEEEGQGPLNVDPETCTTLTTTTTIFGDDDIVAKLVDFWGQALSTDINTFFADNCHVFDEESSEHKLVYTKLHKKYEKIVEEHLQQFREEQGIKSETELYGRIRKCTDKNELAQMIVELVLCCTDFECFVELMKSQSRQKNRIRRALQLDDDEEDTRSAIEGKC